MHGRSATTRRRPTRSIDELLHRVRSWGDVAAAAVAFTTPMSYLAGGGTVHIEGQPPPAGTQPPATFLNHAGHGYFETMQIPDRARPRVHPRGRGPAGDDAPAGDRQRGDGRAVLARAGSRSERGCASTGPPSRSSRSSASCATASTWWCSRRRGRSFFCRSSGMRNADTSRQHEGRSGAAGAKAGA